MNPVMRFFVAVLQPSELWSNLIYPNESGLVCVNCTVLTAPLGCIGASGGRPVGRRGFIAAFGKGLEGRAAVSQRFLSKKKEFKGIEWNCAN